MASSITTKLLPSYYYADSPRDPSAIYREILLTYRLLFGQTSRPRKLLGQQIDRLPAAATTHGHHATISQSSPCSSDGIADEMDPFLATICTSPLRLGWCHLSFSRRRKPSASVPSTIFPSSALDLNDQLQEPDTYSARDDFPVFGSRLLTLQHYNTRQQPSKVKDLWRDRRNPLQWYTFWAVLWIGGASMLLAVLQLLVGVAQLYFAIRPKGGNS